MEPKVLCGACGSPLSVGDNFCQHCGSPVEWPAAVSGETVRSISTESGGKVVKTPASGGRQKASSKQDRPVAPSWKMMAGFALFLAVGVLSLELLTKPKMETIPHTHPEEQAGANMQALQQIEEMERRLAAQPNDQQLLLQLANLLHDNRFYDKAIQRYTEYLKINPNDADARVDLGICYYETDRTNEAKREMLKALEKNPKHLLGHFNLGIVHLRIAQREMAAGNTEQGNKAVEEANEWFRKTAALDPNGEVGQRAQRLLAQHGQSFTQ
jgi:hypothetical protein